MSDHASLLTLQVPVIRPSWLLRPSHAQTLLGVAYLAFFATHLLWHTRRSTLVAFQHRFDEGVYLQTAWLVARGYRLFDEVYYLQSPLLPYALAAVFSVTGPSATIARLLMVATSLLALCAAALIAVRMGGALAGLGAVGLLAVSPQFEPLTHTVMPDMPALALTLLAMALACAYANRRRPAWWLAAATTLAGGALFKLSALVALPALVVLLVLVHRQHLASRAAIRDLLLLLAPLAAALAVTLAIADPARVLDSILLVRARARDAGLFETSPSNLERLIRSAVDYPFLWILAAVGIPAFWLRGNRRLLLPCVVWLGTALTALAVHDPLFSHHLLLLSPPLAILGGGGAATIAVSAARCLERWWVAEPNGRASVLTVGTLGAVGLTVSLMVFVQPGWLDEPRAMQRTSDGEKSQFLAAIEGVVPPDGVLLTDAPMFAFWSDRAVPPALVDISLVRIAVDTLTLRDVQASIARDRPAAILFWGDNLKSVPGFYAWVDRRWIKVRAWGHSKVLYIDPQASMARPGEEAKSGG